MIDEAQTRDFREYCHHLLAAKPGDLCLQQHLLEHGHEATAHMERLLRDMPTLSCGIEQMVKHITETHSSAELKILRRRETYTPEMREKLIQNVLMLATQMFNEHPVVTKPPERPDIRDTFLFRYALSAYVLILKAVEKGGVKTNPNDLRNTMVDVNFATFATYFDCLMTGNTLAGEIYADAEFLLREVFARPPALLRWLLRRRWFSRFLMPSTAADRP